MACKQWNDLPAEETHNWGSYQNPPDLSADTWKLVTFHEVEEGDEVKWLFLPKQCLHCTEASCVSVCPTGAAHYQGEFVVIDENLCVGCGYCVQACPFGVPHSMPGPEDHKGPARKCVFCMDRVTNGLQPACAKTCPAGAYSVGERGKLIAEGRDRVVKLRSNGSPNAQLYGENELGGLHVMFVLRDRPAKYGLPEDPRLATRNVVGQWLAGFLTSGVLAALPFWLVIKRRMKVAAEKGGE